MTIVVISAVKLLCGGIQSYKIMRQSGRPVCLINGWMADRESLTSLGPGLYGSFLIPQTSAAEFQ